MTEWGPWIEHDGARPELSGRHVVQIRCCGAGRALAEGATVTSRHPCWYWRWKSVRVGWFKRERRRVCDDPAFAPIVRYRVRKPSGLVLLELIAAEPSDVLVPVPEGADA